MLDTSQAIGRLVEACQPSPVPTTNDKWRILTELTQAAKAFGLSYRNLAVLKALMSCLPGREISRHPGPAIVFPSNRTLSERLGGMPESTLRRHLAQLVACGLVSRRDSPNRKRFARRVGGSGGIAFGFDLSPLARQMDTIQQHAEQARRDTEYRAVLRAQIMALCSDADDLPPTFSDEIRKTLRRKDNIQELERILTQLRNEPANEMSARNDENERHIQKTDKVESVTQEPVEKPTPSLRTVLAHCPTLKDFYPDLPVDWFQAVHLARKIGPMMGIEIPVLRDAEQKMGPSKVATTIFCMLEKIGTIRNPGGYLRKLSQKAELSEFDVGTMLINQNCHPLTTRSI